MPNVMRKLGNCDGFMGNWDLAPEFLVAKPLYDRKFSMSD